MAEIELLPKLEQKAVLTEKLISDLKREVTYALFYFIFQIALQFFFFLISEHFSVVWFL